MGTMPRSIRMDVDTNSDIDGAAAQRVRGSIGSGIFDGCGTERTAAETSSCLGKTVDSVSGRVRANEASGVSADGAF